MAESEEKYIVHGPPLKYESKYSSVGRFVFDTFKSDPTFIGQVEAFSGHEDTYADMLNRSVRVALWLRSKNVGHGDVVSYCSDNHKESSITCFGTLYVGAAFNPLATTLSIREIVHMMNVTKPKVVFCDEKSSQTIKAAVEQLNQDCMIVIYGDLPDLISFKEIQEQSQDEVDGFQCSEVNENDMALLPCSSGTTGFPKGVQISHKTLLIQMHIYAAIFFGYPPIIMSFSSLNWVTGLLPIFHAVWNKNKHIMPPSCDAETAWKMIEKHRPGVVAQGASRAIEMAYCESVKKYDVSSLQFFLTGGARLPAELKKKFNEIMPNCSLRIIYAMTELYGFFTTQTATSKPGSCGFLVPGASCKIADPGTREAINPHTKGEICCKSPCMFLGYFNDPVQTQLAFDSDGWYHSGDIGHFDEDGELFITDRLKEIFKYRGHHIAPAELETILIEHPGVLNVAVVGKKLDATETIPVAFVVRAAGSKVTEWELCDFLAGQVSDEKRLRGGVRFLEEMPVTPTGKVKKNGLKEMINAEM